MVKLATILLLASLCVFGQQQPKADPPVSVKLPREASLELQLIANEQRDIEEKIAAVIALLRAPIDRALSTVIERECKRAGIVETETETCQIDRQAGVVRRVPKTKPASGGK